MRELAIDALSLLVYAVAAGLLTVAGTAAEYMSFQYVTAGETMVAVWLAAAGAILLYAGITMGHRKVLGSLVG